MAIETAVKIGVDVQGAEQLTDTGKKIENLDKVSANLKTGLKDASKSMEAMGSASGGLGKRLNSVSSNFAKLQTDLSAIPGPVGLAVQSIQGLGTAFKVIIANPIGLAITAIVGALTLLYKAFTSTKEGAESMSRASAALGAVVDVLRDQVVKVSKFLIDAFKNPQKAIMDFGKLLKENIINRFEGILELLPALGKAISLTLKGEFAEAGKTVINATSKIALGVENITDKVNNLAAGLRNVIDEASKEARLAANIEARLQKITDKERALSVERAKQNKIIQEAKLAYQDEALTIEERRKALEKAVALENSLAAQELSLAKQRAKAITERNALSDSSAAALDEEAAAQRRVFELQQQSFAKQTEVAGQIRALNQQERALELAEKQRQEAEEKKIADEKLKREQESTKLLIELTKKQLAEEKAAAEEKIKIEEAKRKAEQDTFDAAQALGTALINLIGNQTKVGKSIALAQIAADTARALSGALANSNSPTPDNVATGGLAGIAKYIALAATIATNAKRAVDILKKGNVSSASGTPVTMSTNIPTVQTPNTRLPQGQDILTQERRVYVLEGDITRTQRRAATNQNVSVLGG